MLLLLPRVVLLLLLCRGPPAGAILGCNILHVTAAAVAVSVAVIYLPPSPTL
jgi:hypothetical protein